jgi:hypothetical protein
MDVTDNEQGEKQAEDHLLHALSSRRQQGGRYLASRASQMVTLV